MSEPVFAVPLDKLIWINPNTRRSWACQFHCAGFSGSGLGSGEVDSEDELVTAAVEHLAKVHGIVPVTETAGVETEWTVTYKDERPGRRVYGRETDPEAMARQHFTYARDKAAFMGAKLWRRVVSRSGWIDVSDDR